MCCIFTFRIFDEPLVGQYAVFLHPDNYDKLFVLGINVERKKMKLDILSEEFPNFKVALKNIEQNLNGQPLYATPLTSIPFALEKVTHNNDRGEEEHDNKCFSYGELFVTGRADEQQGSTTDYYAVLCGHTFIPKTHQETYYENEGDLPIYEYMLTNRDDNISWYLRVPENPGMIKLLMPPFPAYRHIYSINGASRFLHDMVLAKVSGPRLQRLGLRQEVEDVDAERLQIFDSPYGKFKVAGIFPVRSQAELLELNNKVVLIGCMKGYIVPPPRFTVEERLGLHLTFKTYNPQRYVQIYNGNTCLFY